MGRVEHAQPAFGSLFMRGSKGRLSVEWGIFVHFCRTVMIDVGWFCSQFCSHSYVLLCLWVPMRNMAGLIASKLLRIMPKDRRECACLWASLFVLFVLKWLRLFFLAFLIFAFVCGGCCSRCCSGLDVSSYSYLRSCS